MTRRLSAIVLVLLVLFGAALPLWAAAAEPDGAADTQAEPLATTFARAYELTIKGKYEQALPLHDKLVAALPADPAVLYNAGTAHLKAGDLGQAILYLERAVMLSDCPDCVYNLKRAQGFQQDRVVGGSDETTEEAVNDDVLRGLDPDGLAVTLLVFHLLFVAAFLLRRFLRNERARFALLLTLLLFLLADAGLGGLLVLRSQSSEARPRAVVMQPDVTVRNGPNENFPQAFTVHEGLVLRMGERVEDWRQIWLDNGLNGYVPVETLAAIDPKVTP